MTILKHISGIITVLMFCALSSKAQTVITGVVSDGNNPLKTVIIKVVSCTESTYKKCLREE